MKKRFEKVLHFMTKHKNMVMVLMVLIGLCGYCTVAYCASYNISDVPVNIRDKMEISYMADGSILTAILRGIGESIYTWLAMILDPLSDGFTALAKWDVFSLKPIKDLNMDMEQIIKIVIPLCLSVCALLNLLHMKNPLSVLYNASLTVMAIALFIGVMGLGSNLKNGMIKEIENINGINQQTTLSQGMYKDNTVDIKKSIENKKLWYLSDYGSFDLKNYDYNEVLSKDVINTRYTTSNGSSSVTTLNDGVMGILDQRYYAYTTDYFALNFTMLPLIVIYLVGIYKLAYIIGEWIKITTTGGLFMLKGFNDTKAIGKVYSSGFNNLVSICIVYFGMMFFSIISQAIIKDNTFNNWIISALVIFAIGMSLVAGSGFFNDVLGVDDGSKFMMKSMFMGHRMSRMAKNAVGTGMAVAGVGAYGAYKTAQFTGDKMKSAVQNSQIKRDNEQNAMERDRFINEKMAMFNQKAIGTTTDDNIPKLDDKYSSDGKIDPLENVRYEADENGSITPKSYRPDQFKEEYMQKINQTALESNAEDQQYTRYKHNADGTNDIEQNKNYRNKGEVLLHNESLRKQAELIKQDRTNENRDFKNRYLHNGNQNVEDVVNANIKEPSINDVNDSNLSNTEDFNDNDGVYNMQSYKNELNDSTDYKEDYVDNGSNNDIRSMYQESLDEKEIQETGTKIEFEDKYGYVPQRNYSHVDEFAKTLKQSNPSINYTNRDVAEMYNRYQQNYIKDNDDIEESLQNLMNDLSGQIDTSAVSNGEDDPWVQGMRKQKQMENGGGYYRNYKNNYNKGVNKNGNNSKR